MTRPPLTDEDGEMRELTAEDMKLFRPIAEVAPGLADAMKAMRNKGGRPRVDAPRAHITFRWDPDLVASIKATGRGFNARVEKIIREAHRTGKL